MRWTVRQENSPQHIANHTKSYHKERNKMFTTFGQLLSRIFVAMLLSIILGGCAPATPAPQSAPPAAPTVKASASSAQPPAPQPTAAAVAKAEPAATPVRPLPTSAAPAAPASLDRDHTLVIGVAGDMTGWDPATASYFLANEIIQNTHDTLVDLDKVTDAAGNVMRDVNKLIPALAESWQVSPDGKTFTFPLRKGAKFNNGDPVNAQAVKDSVAHDLKVPNMQKRLTSLASLDSLDRVTVDDEYTVSFHLPVPSNVFVPLTSKFFFGIVNTRQIEDSAPTFEKQQAWAAVNVTGSGPFSVEKYEPGVQLVLKAKPDYWGGKPYFASVIYRIIPEANDRLMLLRNGDIDIAYDISLKDYGTLRSDPNINAYATPGYGILFMHFRLQEKPWDNVLLRKAIAYAIPYDTIIKTVSYGFASPAQSTFPAGMEGYVPANPYKYDLEQAKQLLTQAGYPGGKGLAPLTFNIKQGNPEEESVAVYIQAELAKLGVTINIKPLSVAVHTDLNFKHQLPWTFNYYLPAIPSPYYQLWFLAYTKNSASGCCNFSSYGNPKVDVLIDQIQAEQDAAKRVELAKRAQQLIAEDVPMIPIYQPTWNVAMRKGIVGYSYYPDAMMRFAQLSRTK
jgi:peptide/nickel transport system substrate-binding protein